MKNKKILIIVSLIVLISLILYIGRKDQIQNGNVISKISSSKDLKIIVATDIHYIDSTLKDNGIAFSKFYESGDGKELKYIEEITDAFIEDVIKEKPDVLVLTGDLTTNGEKLSHEKLGQKLKKVKDSGILVYTIPGNHDINNPWARKFKDDKQFVTDFVSPKEFTKIYDSFGYGDALKKDEDSMSYLSSPNGKLFFLMLDTCKYYNNENLNYPQTGGNITEKTYDWINKCMEYVRNQNGQVLVFMHHNLLDHSEVVREGFTIDDNMNTINMLLKNNIKVNFSGHIHIQSISSYEKNKIYDIATGSLSVYPQKYGVIDYKVKDKRLEYKTQWVDVENFAKKNNITDKNLLNFKEYSKENFLNYTKVKFEKSFMKDTEFSEEEKKDILNFIGIVNLKYFEGTINKDDDEYNLDKLKSSDTCKKIENSSNEFLKRYVNSILKDNGIDSNDLTINLSDVEK